MAKFDRSKFQAAKVADLQEQKKKAEELKPKSNNTRPGYVELTKGDNTVRIFPPHPDTPSYIYQKCVHWLPFEVKETDDKGKEQVVVKKKPVFNARIHAGTPQDVIDEYIAAAKRIIQRDTKDATEVKKKIDNLYHWKNGVSGSYSWVVYANVKNTNGSNFGRLEIKNSIKYKLDEISMVENSDDPMEVDPFTDPDNGYAVKITYTTGENVKPQDVYKAAIIFNKPAPLSDDELEKFADMDSLQKLLVNSYTARDFEKAIEGLEVYDKQNKLGVFADEDFLDVCSKLAELYPDAPEADVADDGDELPFKEGGEAKEDHPANDNKKDTQWIKDMDKDEPETKEEEQEYPSKEMSNDDKAKKLAALKAKLGKG